MTPWDSDKSTAADPDNPAPDEQLTADEWDAHVTEGHFPADELNLGVDGGDPVMTDPQNGDQIVLRYDRSAGSWVFQSVTTDQQTISDSDSGLDPDTTSHLEIQRTGTDGQTGRLLITDDGGRIADSNDGINARLHRADGTINLSRNIVHDGSDYVLEDDSASQRGTFLEVGYEGVQHFLNQNDGGGLQKYFITSANFSTPRTSILKDSLLVVGDEEGETNTFYKNRLQVLGDGQSAETSSIFQGNYGANNGAVTHIAAKSRSGDVGSLGSPVKEDDGIFALICLGDDGTDWQGGSKAAQLDVQVDGSVSSDTVPGRLKISTTNSSGSLTEAFRVDSGQHLDFQANATETSDGMNKDPESSTEDAFITVKLNGTTYEIPAYATA